jgi:hypothetical protein
VRRLLAIVTLPVVLAAVLVGVTGAQQHAMAAPQTGQGCILGLICIPGSPSPTPTPTPTPSQTSTPAPSPSASPSSSPTAGAAAPSPSLPLPLPSLGVPSLGVLPSSNPVSSSLGGLIPGLGSTSPAATASPTEKTAAGTPGLVASDANAVLTAGTANIAGFHYVGNVNVPTAGGTQQMMEFTADSIDLSGTVTVTVIQNGVTVTTVSASQDFSDGVTLYATKLTGSLQAVAGLGVPGVGVPLTFTPATIGVSLLNLPNIGELQLTNLLTGAIPLTITGVTTDQLLISGGTQVTTQLSMS